MEVRCQQCGAAAAPEEAFCQQCGAVLGAEPPAADGGADDSWNMAETLMGQKFPGLSTPRGRASDDDAPRAEASVAAPGTPHATTPASVPGTSRTLGAEEAAVSAPTARPVARSRALLVALVCLLALLCIGGLLILMLSRS